MAKSESKIEPSYVYVCDDVYKLRSVVPGTQRESFTETAQWPRLYLCFNSVVQCSWWCWIWRAALFWTVVDGWPQRTDKYWAALDQSAENHSCSHNYASLCELPQMTELIQARAGDCVYMLSYSYTSVVNTLNGIIDNEYLISDLAVTDTTPASATLWWWHHNDKYSYINSILAWL